MKVDLKWSAGDWAIYIKQKQSAAPGPRARDVMPATHGETYSYLVEKCWVVLEVLDSGELKLITRRGKIHTISPNDPALRKPTLWQKLTLASRFRSIPKTPEEIPLTEQQKR